MNNITKSGSFKRSITISVIAIIAYIVTWRFYVAWSLIIFFVDVIIFCVFAIFFIGGIVFWIDNRKLFRYSFLPLWINILTISIVIIGPSKDFNKSYFEGAYDLNKYQKSKCSCHLYVETYCVFKNGYMTTNINSMYFTDSLNFRKYLGTYDEADKSFDIKCVGDSVFVEKAYQFYKTNQKSYSLKDLIHSHVFE